MGKKTSTTKPAAPEKRAAKTKTTAEKADIIAPADAKATTAKPKRPVRSAKPVAKRSAKSAFTPEDIALRAYFIAERRQAAGLAGDAHQDWIDAERELASETASAKKARTKKR